MKSLHVVNCSEWKWHYLAISFELTLNSHLIKTVRIQKSNEPSQMCPKVINFVRILKIQFGRVVEDFKLNPLIFNDLVQKWKIPTIESLV